MSASNDSGPQADNKNGSSQIQEIMQMYAQEQTKVVKRSQHKSTGEQKQITTIANHIKKRMQKYAQEQFNV